MQKTDSAESCVFGRCSNLIDLDEGSGFLEVTENLVYRVDKPLYYNNLYLARNETCSVHDNLFAQQPDFDGGMPPAAREAGIEPAYQDILAKQPVPSCATPPSGCCGRVARRR